MRTQIETHIKAAVERLKSYQTSSGGFSPWPVASGGFWVSPLGSSPNDWTSSYVGHFLLEAQKAGYLIPNSMLQSWKNFQGNQARSFVTGKSSSELAQAYRLYTLALSGTAELGAMNRLKEATRLNTSTRFRLAATYALAGQPEVALGLLPESDEFPDYRELGGTYGSALRDKAMALETLILLKLLDRAKPLAEEIANHLSSDKWLSTQEAATCLMAMARYTGLNRDNQQTRFIYRWDQGESNRVDRKDALVSIELPIGTKLKSPLEVRNESDHVLYARINLRGIPEPGTETSYESGLGLKVSYVDLGGNPLDFASLEQGTDFKVRLVVTNFSHHIYDQIALTHLVASGWEIHNESLFPTSRAQSANFEFREIKDDRIYTYFKLSPKEEKIFEILLNASYLGKFYQPLISVEAMYDGTINAREKGTFVNVILPE